MAILYNVYNNISDDDFENIEKELKLFAPIMRDILSRYKFKPTDPSFSNDGLTLDYITGKGKDIIHGNIGFTYDDLAGKQTFSFYLLKTYDEPDRRYFKKVYIKEPCSLEYIEENIDSLIDTSIQLYESWTREDMDEYVVLRK